MNKKTKAVEKSIETVKIPMILRLLRLVDAFAKADDERDFFLNIQEGYILFFNLDKTEQEIMEFEADFERNGHQLLPIPKLSFYEQKKIMEGFVNDKIYDIDIKEKLLDLISSQSPRENFLEFLVDHEAENDKWQNYYLEKFRIIVIEWLRAHKLNFVFEEDLGLNPQIIEKIKRLFFTKEIPKELHPTIKVLDQKAHSYYSDEALNPRPKRGRPPKQAAKVETTLQLSADIYTKVPSGFLPFLHTPVFNEPTHITFSPQFTTHAELLSSFKVSQKGDSAISRLEELANKLAILRENA